MVRTNIDQMFCILDSRFDFLILIFHVFAAMNLIFSFTNGVEWDGPYRMQFQVPRRWKNRPIEFFNEVISHLLHLENL